MKALRAVSLLAALICLFPGGARALDPSRDISQYAHSAWRIQDGVFSGTPTAITQTKDGYLWIGTVNGLFRFDGVRFSRWSPDGQQLLSASIYALLGARDGSLWIGTGEGLFQWTHQDFIHYPAAIARINCILEDRKGQIWIARSRIRDWSGAICQAASGRLKCYGKADGIPTPYAVALAEDPAGNLWIAGSSMLVRWRPGSSETYHVNGLQRSEGLAGIEGIAAASDNSLWVGLERAGLGLGLQQLVEGVWKPFIAPALDGTTLEVTTLFSDRDNALWVGTQSQGIYRIQSGKIDRFESADGLSSDSIFDFYQDHEGDIWVATSKGIDSFRNLSVASFSKREGLYSDEVSSVLASRDGTIWIGTAGALDSIRSGKVSSIRAQNGLPGRRVTSLLEDHTGLLWVGVDKGLFVCRQGRFDAILKANGQPTGILTGIIEDTNGDIWAKSSSIPESLIRLHQRKVIQEFATPPLARSFAIAADPGGGIWLIPPGGKVLARFRDGHLQLVSEIEREKTGVIDQVLIGYDGFIWGAARKALVGWKKGILQTLTMRNGLPCDGVYSLVSDGQHALWLYTPCGLIRVAQVDLEKWWKAPDIKVSVRVFGSSEGVQAAQATFEPAAARSADGRLWFVNDSVLQMIDPSHLEDNPLPPPVHVEQLTADGKNYPSSGTIHLPPLTRDIEINYTALSFVMPQQVRFRYQLEGQNPAWQEAGGRRSVFYMNLSPAHYKFHVIACNNDGVWNERGAWLDFTIPPAWYQTGWFKAGYTLVAFALCYLFYRLRMQQVSASLRLRFDERLEERTRLARDLHDTLIQTIQGGKLVADQAREGPSDLARLQNAVDLLSEWLARAIMEGRAALATLRTSTTEGNDLAEALRRAGDDCRINNSIQVWLSSRGESKDMHPIARDEVYRIGYEAIQNACVHSGGTQISVELEYNQDLRLLVRDNGHGMEEQIVRFGKAGHFGLQGMRERALRIGGKLTLVSSQQGTEISLVVPGNTIFKAPLKRKPH